MKQREKRNLTDRLAPMMQGLYSMQAVAREPGEPDVTVFRMQAKQAVAWKDEMVKHDRFAWFLLRHAIDAWDVYDSFGNLTALCKQVCEKPIQESRAVIPISREQIVEEARLLLGEPNLTLLTCADAHAGASAADHSNFEVMCRRMIIDAKPHDLSKIYMVDSRRWACRVVGVFADIAQLSPEMQDVFLERYKWLAQSWPMRKNDHLDVLAARLATAREKDVHALLRDCGNAAGLAPEVIQGMQAKWSLCAPKAKYRFARHIVETLAGGVKLHLNEAETFDPEEVERKGSAVVRGYRKLMQ